MTDRTLREKIAAMIIQQCADQDDVVYNMAIGDVLRILDAHTAAQPAPDAVAEAAKVLLSDNDAVTELAVETYRHNQPDAGGKRRGYRPSVIAALQCLAKGSHP